ncbi:protein stichel [Phtheirospermum japonicum]|uniref:Protein stichel n=1 Tax=Phtheirospermum japonicum TaxID=374723 RepID=A0A830CKZ7_9LAMI|nr:protein stichel [Phtheirospermum japonicum]
MVPVEMGGGGGGRGGGTAAAASGGGNIDPSNLHLKKELTQIRKAARVLRDPGTSSSSWRSPLNSARSLTKHHYVHHHKSGNEIISSSQQFLQSNVNSINNLGSGVVASDNKCNVSAKEREKRVFLYNWRSQRSESDRTSKQIRDDLDDVENNSKDEGSFSTSVDMDSGVNDFKSDAYMSEKYTASDIFRCKDTDFTPSIMRTIKKKPKRISYSNNHTNFSAILRHRNEKLQKQIILSSSLVDQSDDTEDYLNSEDLTSRASAISPLLARFKNKGRARAHHRKEDDSILYNTPPLSASSHHRNNKYGFRNPSTVESWDATTGSLNDYADDEVDDHLDLPGRQGCGIPCYWSKRSTPKSRVGYGSCCSPSLSDTLRRKGSSIFCGTQSIHQRRRLGSNKRRPSTRIPLLTSKGSSSDELSTNFGEIDLEALSRLDGRRWSSSCCRSQEGLEIVVHDEMGLGSPDNVKSLSHKYRPMFFDELIGQNLVVQSLKSAISRKRVGPIYLFQGPRGTGKTSAVRIFAAALNCLASEENNTSNSNNKPCGVCRECGNYVSGKSDRIVEVDGSSKTGIEKIKNLLKSLSAVRASSSSQFRVFVVDECHLLPSKTWLMFLRFLEKPLPRVVFVLITSDVDNVPRTILSRCQRHLFNKISNGDIVARLRKIGDDEGLDVEPDALEMIALNADGSLRDAETMLDQLSLFGKRISVSLVHELIGVVSDEKLLELLELAMSSNATETVKRARELMDSGVDPILLMSQMATIIVDIIAGTYPSGDGKRDSFFGGRNLSERELDRLKHALTLLSEAEKHLRVSSERSTWFTATLLQLGSGPSSSERAHSGSSRRQSSKATEDGEHASIKSSHHDSTSKDNNNHVSGNNNYSGFNSNPSGPSDSKTGRTGALRCVNSEMLSNIWLECIEKCHSKTLRQLLHSHGRLVSITEIKAHIGFVDKNIKTRAEGFLSSITNSFEIVLHHNVEVKIIRLPDFFRTDKNTAMSPENNKSCAVSNSGGHQIGPSESVAENANVGPSKSEIPVKRIESIIHEQRLETAWLQAMDRGTTPRSTSRLKPERNQVLPQDVGLNEFEPLDSVEDELNREIKALKINDQIVAKRIDHFPISPSLLHNGSFTSRDNM